MRIFPHFTQSGKAVCPLCKTSKDAEVVLIGIPGTEDDNTMEARQVHKDCWDLHLKMNDLDPERYED